MNKTSRTQGVPNKKKWRPVGVHYPNTSPGFAGPTAAELDKGTDGTWAPALLWNEFAGAVLFSLIFCFVVLQSGGSLMARLVPFLFGSAFAGGFGYFAATFMFGSVSGGHYNPIITLSVMFLELISWLGAFDWLIKRQGNTIVDKHMLNVESTGHFIRRMLIMVGYIIIDFLAFLLVAWFILLAMGDTALQHDKELGMPMKAVNSKNFGNTRIFWAEVLGSTIFVMGFLLLHKTFGDRNWGTQLQRATAFGFFYFVLILAFMHFGGATWNPSLLLAFAIISGNWSNFTLMFWNPWVGAGFATVICIFHWFITGFNAKNSPLLGTRLLVALRLQKAEEKKTETEAEQKTEV